MGTEIETYGCFNANIEEVEFHVTVHVVANDVIPVDLLIGCDLLSDAKVTIDENGVKMPIYVQF